MSQRVSTCLCWFWLTLVSKNQGHFYKNTHISCPYLCVSQNIRMCVCICIIPTLLKFLMSQKVTSMLSFGFLAKNFGSWQDLLMVLCRDTIGLFILFSSVELITAESLNSTVLFTNNTSDVSELYGNGTNFTVTEEPVTIEQAKLAEIARQIQLWEISRLMQVYGRPPIIILGTLGNVLAFIVMRRGSMKHVSTCFYMAILALADTGL